jgi:hypothetical protein
MVPTDPAAPWMSKVSPGPTARLFERDVRGLRPGREPAGDLPWHGGGLGRDLISGHDDVLGVGLERGVTEDLGAVVGDPGELVAGNTRPVMR